MGRYKRRVGKEESSLLSAQELSYQQGCPGGPGGRSALGAPPGGPSDGSADIYRLGVLGAGGEGGLCRPDGWAWQPR